MSEVLYNDIGQSMKEQFGTGIGQMFGKPCLKTPANKAFAVFYNGEMVFKLGREEVHLLKDKYPGATNFDPSGKGRPMKDWLQLPEAFQQDWPTLAKQALDFVLVQ